MVIMPFVVPLLLAIWLRRRLRRHVGRRVGNILGKGAIITFGGPPLVLAGILVLLMRLVLAAASKLEQAAKARREA
jgi:hypothetical protein